VPRDVVRQLPERLQELLGYNIYPPFLGYVDGVHPRRVLSADQQRIAVPGKARRGRRVTADDELSSSAGLGSEHADRQEEDEEGSTFM